MFFCTFFMNYVNFEIKVLVNKHIVNIMILDTEQQNIIIIKVLKFYQVNKPET